MCLMKPSADDAQKTVHVSFRMPCWVLDLLAEVRQRLGSNHPLKKPPSRVEVIALALEAYSKRVPKDDGKTPPGQEPIPPIIEIPVGFARGDVVWSSANRRDPSRRRYLIEEIKVQRSGRNPKLRGWKVDARGERYGGVVKLPAGRYEKAPLGQIEGVTELFEGPRFYVKYGGSGFGWGVWERFNLKDEIFRGRWYPDEETAQRAVPFVARGEYPMPGDPRLADDRATDEETARVTECVSLVTSIIDENPSITEEGV